MIDKVYILNIESEQERRENAMEHLSDIGVPVSKIEIWDAKTCAPYAKTADLCAAAGETLPIFRNLLASGNYKECYITYLAQAWSYLSFWQHLQRTGETAILMHDDVDFLCSFENVLKACDKLPKDVFFAFLSFAREAPIDVSQIVSYDEPWIRYVDDRFQWDAVMLFTSSGSDLLLSEFNKLDWLGDGWFMNGIWRNEFFDGCGGIYELAVNPNKLTQTREALTSMVTTPPRYETEFSSVTNNDLAFPTVIRDSDSRLLRSKESTN